ncbi:MAG: hypothetical protein HY056_05495 [Proteobacteria bacterium]|nr:hypothetical protein [Pseudomonadota bacterium]
MLAMREFDWSYELAMYAGTAACLVFVALLVGGTFAVVGFLLRRNRRRRGMDQP